ncbi:NADH-quinone oxidoreductase subunit M [Oligella ureolytica]
MTTFPWLSLSIFVPIVAGIFVLVFGHDDRAEYTKKMALIGAIVSFLVTLPLLFGFDSTTAEMQFVESVRWISALGAHYHLGIDGISVWLVLLTASRVQKRQ